MRINGLNSANLSSLKPVKAANLQNQLSFGWFNINDRMYSDHFVFERSPERAVMPFDVETARAACQEPQEVTERCRVYKGSVPYMNSNLTMVMSKPERTPQLGEGVITAYWENEALNHQPGTEKRAKSYTPEMLGKHIVVKENRVVSDDPIFDDYSIEELKAKYAIKREKNGHKQDLEHNEHALRDDILSRLTPLQPIQPAQRASIAQPEITHTLKRRRGASGIYAVLALN